MIKNAIPEWLLNAITEQHLSLTLQTLAQREYQRERFRAISRRQVRLSSSSGGSVSPPKDLHPSLETLAHTVSQGHYSVAFANQEENINRNRYLDVVPYDRTRVVVGDGINEAGRYLNANWVLERFGRKWWIATQAPLPSTAHAFLSVILQPASIPPKTLSSASTAQEEAKKTASRSRTSHIRTVVQLTKSIESGRTKAHPYFPSQVGKTLIVPPEPGCLLPALKVTLLQSHTHDSAQCIQSTVAVTPVETNSNVPHSDAQKSQEKASDYGVEDRGDHGIVFQHLLYTAWPDHGVPEDGDRQSLFEFIKLVDRTNRDLTLRSYPPISPSPESQDPDPPIVVGCSAGIGRTGTFIALSSLLRYHGFIQPAALPTPTSILPPSPLGVLPDELVGDYVAEEIDSLREQRPRMVERQEQIILIYELLIDVFQTRLTTF